MLLCFSIILFQGVFSFWERMSFCLFACCFGDGELVIHQTPKSRSVRMSGKWAGISEKSDFEVFVPVSPFFFFPWESTFELKLQYNPILEFTFREKRSILLRADKSLISLLCQKRQGGVLLGDPKSIRRADPTLARPEVPRKGMPRMQ